MKKTNFSIRYIIFLAMVLFVIVLGFYLFQIKRREYFQDGYSKTVFIIPSTSRNMNYKDIKSCSLIKILYASLEKLDTSKYTFLIGTDDDDEFYNNNVDALKSTLPQNFHFHSLNNFDKSYVCIVNQLADIAIRDYSADYIYVFADDLEVYDLNFIETDFIPYFKENGDLCLGWGIDENWKDICTHPFSSKKHVDRLGYFYPPSIKNVGCDDWIQRLYEKLKKIKRTKKSVIKNIIGANDTNRYEISRWDSDGQAMEDLLSNALEKLA